MKKINFNSELYLSPKQVTIYTIAPVPCNSYHDVTKQLLMLLFLVVNYGQNLTSVHTLTILYMQAGMYPA